MSFTFIGGSNGVDDALESKVSSLSRQLNALIGQIEGGSAQARNDVEAADLFSRLGALNCETASQALRKASLKATTLLSRASAGGFHLALLMSRQIPWVTQSGDEGVLPRHAHDWLAGALSYLASDKSDAEVLTPLLELITKHLVHPSTASRPEYTRHVVSPNLGKLPGLLAARLERGQRNELPLLLNTVADEIEVRANTYRSVASRLHASASAHIADPSAQIRLAAIRLLGQLHLTGAVGERGAGKESSSAHLWSATIKAAIGSARSAFQDCTTTFVRRHVTPQAQLTIQGTPLERLHLAINLLPALLSLPTQRAVPVPLARLFGLAHDMLSVIRPKATVEADVNASEAASLVQVRLLALQLLVISLETACLIGQDAVARFASQALEDAVTLLEDKAEPAAVRAAAAEVLAVQVSLDPSSRLVLRASRACLAALVPQQLFSQQATRPPQKRSRARYESDAVASGSQVPSPSVDPHLSRSCLAALPHLFPHLCTSLTPQHFDLAHTAAQLVIALGPPAVPCLARLVECCPAGSPLLGLMVPKLSEAARWSGNAEVQRVLREVLMPRLPPVLAGRQDDRGDEGEDEATRDWGIDPETGRETTAKTGPVYGGEVTTREALEAVGLTQPCQEVTVEETVVEVQHPSGDTLAAPEPTVIPVPPASSTSAPTGPRHSSPAAMLSPEPTKPLLRPTTPKIGSPRAVSASNATLGAAAAASPEAKEVFAAPAPPARPAAQPQNALAEDSDDEELPEIDLRSDDDEDDE
ncbi:hypothetical protein BDZ90DRAFT_230662 [Jaminaea rosea]|uniref:Uncharacterized protein n=1 Tax=Jaminaea rosea TaxID=1569628 RepID=A0A316V0X6_9BASI|nr:hypothetical protein BDZ90DRAFT_230662 [Jaminaea rosea]PWN29823.1 hypothetical protein BDZ90DRAFT_230662 [Jaminaea rosea]